MNGKIVKQDMGPNECRVEIANVVDEHLPFPTDLGLNLARLTIDFGEVTHMNSMGLRNWTHWIKSIVETKPQLKLELTRLPLAFIRALEVVSGLLPSSATVSSFYLDLFCDRCDHSANLVLLNKPGLKLPQTACPKCGQNMRTELHPEVYEPLVKHAPKVQ